MARFRFYSTLLGQSSKEEDWGELIHERAREYSSLCCENGWDSHCFIEIYDEGLKEWVPVYAYERGSPVPLTVVEMQAMY